MVRKEVDALNTVFFHTHATVIAVLCLVVLAVAILGPLAWDAAVDGLRVGCDAGTVDAGFCFAAEVGGLVAR